MTESARARWTTAVVAIVAVALVLVELDVARRASVTFDEPVHASAGFSYLAHREVVLSPDHPPLARLLSGASQRAFGVRESDAAGAIYDDARADPVREPQLRYPYGYQLIVRDNASLELPGAARGPGSVLLAARLPWIVFPLAIALIAFAWSRSLYGARGGLIALGLVVTFPDLLGHGALVTTDAPCAALVLASAFALRTLARRGGAAALAAFGAAVGAALAAKFSAVMALPALAAAAALFAWRPVDPAPVSVVHPCGVGSWRERARAVALAAVASGAIAYVVLLVAYLGREPVSALRAGSSLVYTKANAASVGYEAMCLGRYGDHFWYFFLVATALKAPLGTLALLALSAFAAAADSRARAPLVEEVALVLPGVVFFAAMSVLAGALGTRYVLPAMPFFLIAAGRLARWAEGSRARWLPIVVALAANVIGAAVDHPFHASSTNALAGPPELVYRWLDDSCQEWGQGLGGLAEWQRRRGVDEVTVVSSIPVDTTEVIRAYGVRGDAIATPGSAIATVLAPEPGKVYAVSAHLVSRCVLHAEAARAAGKPAPAVALGEAKRPEAIVGGGLLIFDLRVRR